MRRALGGPQLQREWGGGTLTFSPLMPGSPFSPGRPGGPWVGNRVWVSLHGVSQTSLKVTRGVVTWAKTHISG